MSLSQSRKAQIESNLAKHGITADETAINGVTDILKNDQRATVASACRRYAQSVNPQIKAEEPQQPTGETATNTTSNGNVQTDLQNLSTNIGDRIAEGVISQAVDHAMKRILSGDWTLNSQAKQSLENTKQALDVEFSTISENFLSLPSNGLSNGKLLPSSEEIFDHAVVGQLTSSELT